MNLSRVVPAMLLSLVCAVPAVAVSDSGRPPDIIVIVIDTARRDFFSTYGYEKETTPAFTAFAERAVLFDRAYSTSCWTVPSHASLFTGEYPVAHGANQETRFLHDDARTLAEILAEHGYDTAAFSGNPWISAKANLAQGFAEAKVVFSGKGTVEGNGLPHRLNTKALEWLDARDETKPFLLFLNYIEPHWKYQAPVELQRKFVPGGKEVAQDDPAMFSNLRWYLRPFEDVVDRLPVRTGMYVADLAFADTIFEEMMAGLEERGLLDGSLVVVTSDHGENHGDNDHLNHMFTLNEGAIRIPLAIKLPSGSDAGTVRADPVQLVDLFPTVLSAAGVERPAGAAGAHDLFAGPAPEDRPLLAEYYYPDQILGFYPKGAPENELLQPYLRRIKALRVGDWKFLWGSDGVHELYDLSTDPGETTNLVEKEPERAAGLEGRLEEVLERFGGAAVESAVAPGIVDPEIEEQLRSLGYVR